MGDCPRSQALRSILHAPAAHRFGTIACIFLLVGHLGCASDTYHVNPTLGPVPSIDIRVGPEKSKWDRCESIVQYPRRTITKWRSKEEAVPTEDPWRTRNVSQAHEYLALHGEQDLLISVREYDPGEQWRRLRANQEISCFWKYSAGLMQHLQYCMLPGRVFHNDQFNVYTRTLSINSTRPEQSLYHASTARYLLHQRYPGAYSAACFLPIVPLHRDYHVANDVLSYARYRQDWETEKALYPTIYGNFGGDVVSQATSIVPSFAYVPFYVKPALKIGGNLAGRGIGGAVSKRREATLKVADSP